MNQSQNKNIDESVDYGSVDLSKAIMQKIKSGGVKMKSRWIFYAQKLGLRSGFILLITVMALFINIFLYILKQNGALEFLDFGVTGLDVVLSNVPYDIFLLVIVFAVLANLILKTFDIEHKKYFYTLSVVSVVIATGCGVAVFSSGINDTIREKIQHEKMSLPMVNKFYKQDRLQLNDDNSLIGQVVSYDIDVKDQPFMVITKNGEMITVQCENCLKHFNNIDIGQIIKAIGQMQNNQFVAQQVRLMSNEAVFRPIISPMPLTQVEIKVSR